jgi:hypothetical protein
MAPKFNVFRARSPLNVRVQFRSISGQSGAMPAIGTSSALNAFYASVNFDALMARS